jgi:hypothetical protein
VTAGDVDVQEVVLMASPGRALAAFAALAVLWSWPLPLLLSSHVAADPGDPMLNAWILWWNAQAVPFSTRWWNAPVFHPMPGALALSEHLAGIAAFTTPLLMAGVSPVVAYNLALLLSFVLCGFFMYLLVLRLTGSPWAAFCAGVAFAYAPYRAGHLSHLQVLTAQWLPLQLLGLHAYLDSGRRGWLAVFGLAWILQALSNGYYLLFAVPLVLLWLAWFVAAHRRWRRGLAIVAVWGVSCLALLPGLLTYRDVHETLGVTRSRGEMLMFSARRSSFLAPPEGLSLWPAASNRTPEGDLFPGLTIVVVLGLALVHATIRRGDAAVRCRRELLVFYAVAAVAMGALACGPAPFEAGAAGWLRPYEWLMHLPGYGALRVPARFAMLMVLCLAVAGGIGLAMLLPASPRARAAAAVVAAAALAAEGWVGQLAGTRPPARLAPVQADVTAVLELPPHDIAVNLGAMWRGMSHGLPVVNGYSGHIPPHYDVLVRSIERGDPSAVLELARGGGLLLAVAERHDPGGHYRQFVEHLPGVVRQQATSAGMTYVLPRQPRGRLPPAGEDYPFEPTWLPRRHVSLDLHGERVVRRLKFPLRDRYADLDGRVAVEASIDGASWEMVWEGWTGGLALAGTLEDPRHAPVRLVLPDVRTRYLRLHPVDAWLVDGLTVSGPG